MKKFDWGIGNPKAKVDRVMLFALPRDDVQQGIVWLQDPTLPPRGVVRISHRENKKTVYCESMQIDSNFLRHYNEPPRIQITDPVHALVIGGWHRAMLGNLPTRQHAELTIVPCLTAWGKVRACIDHPQTVVRVGAWLGLIGLLLGIVGTILGAVPFIQKGQFEEKLHQTRKLTELETSKLMLNASLGNGKLTGKFFNQTPDVVVTRITVEAVPKEEKNIFNSSSPRFFNATATAKPRAMSTYFEAETGDLNPDFHTLRIVEAQGVSD